MLLDKFWGGFFAELRLGAEHRFSLLVIENFDSSPLSRKMAFRALENEVGTRSIFIEIT